jgi:nitrate reductase NapE component
MCPGLIGVFWVGILTVCSTYRTIAIVGEKMLIILLVAVNLVAGFGFAVPIARLLAGISGRPGRFLRYLVFLIGIYFVECVAFSAGMCTQVFSIGLAFLWGIIFGLWLRSRTSARRALTASFLVSIYTSLPTASFCILIPVAGLVGGGHILSAQEGTSFGIPDFLPWPLNTIFGFFVALLIGTLVFKTIITTGEVSLLIHLGEKPAIGR